MNLLGAVEILVIWVGSITALMVLIALVMFRPYLKTYQGGWLGLTKDIVGYFVPMGVLVVLGLVGFEFFKVGQMPAQPILIGAGVVALVCVVVMNLPPIKAGRQRHVALIRARKARNRW